MTYVKINNMEFQATINGKFKDSEWNGRESKTIKLPMDYPTATSLFHDGVTWSIIDRTEDGETQEWDNSEFSIPGDIVVHQNGYVSVKMGKRTEVEDLSESLEEAYELLYGGVE